MMRTALLQLSLALFAGPALAATDVRVEFTLSTADAYGAPIQQRRYYYVYRPDNLPNSTPVPMILVLEASPNSGPAGFFHRKADEAGFVVVSCSFSGNSTGTPGTTWNNHDPHITGWEDFDYLDEVIERVKGSHNCNDVFITGISKAGHASFAYACERPATIKAAGPLDEFMGLGANIPTAPVPMIVFQGTMDTNVPYTMVRDSVDAWRAVNGVAGATPITTYESSPLGPGRVSQASWRGGTAGAEVAFVTIVGGTHTYPVPTVQSGYDYPSGVWAFFSQYLTSLQSAPKIVSQPVDQVQISGQPASFRAVATGDAPLRYQWQKNGLDIPGANENWYTAPRVSPGDNGAAFRAVVANDSGTATSIAAKLTVRAAPAGPAITKQPSPQSIIAGQAITFTVGATGTPPLSYQWKKNGMNIAGATSDTLSTPAAITPDSGAGFTVAVTSAEGTVDSTPATLTVTAAPGAPVMLANVERSRVLVNQPATFSVGAWSASPMTFQWQRGPGTGNMADIPGATEPTYTLPSAALTDHLSLFRCVVSNAAGNTTSASEMLAVTAAPTPPTQMTSPITASAKVGTLFDYSIKSTGGTSPVTFSATPLPAGLSVDASSGRISGMPAEAGVTKVVIEASNKAGKLSSILSLTVTDTLPALTIEQWRRANFGASAIDPAVAGDLADPDGDGYTNLDEFTSGSNPLDAASVPAAPAERL